jgi:hypothetical protein
MLPVVPEVDAPDFSSASPLVPELPPLLVSTESAPLDVSVETPDFTSNAPPSADADEEPPLIVVDPLDALAVPAEMSIFPAVPVLPLFTDNTPDEPAVESPVYK